MNKQTVQWRCFSSIYQQSREPARMSSAPVARSARPTKVICIYPVKFLALAVLSSRCVYMFACERVGVFYAFVVVIMRRLTPAFLYHAFLSDNAHSVLPFNRTK